jgi:DNA-binding transcriptional ArsR family regulator
VEDCPISNNSDQTVDLLKLSGLSRRTASCGLGCCRAGIRHRAINVMTIGTEMPSQALLNDDHFFDYGAVLLTALANRNRLVILRILIKGEMSVSALALLTGIGNSALSQHLTKLRGAGLVIRRRDAQTVYYSCKSDEVKQVLQTLEEIWPDSHIKRKSFDGTASSI